MPTCVAPNASDPCGEATVVSAVCDAAAHTWSCPSGARFYTRAAETPQVCRPFQGSSSPAPGGWGLSAMRTVPTDDGRCLWVSDTATLLDGTTVRNVAFQPDPTEPFGTCPSTSVMPPKPIVTVETGDDPSVVIQIDGGYRLGGTTHVLYRVFRTDSAATFGFDLVGGGVGRWDQTTGRIVIPTVTPPFPWGTDLDLGDAALVATDGLHAYVWGCAQPGMFLVSGCELARLDATDHVELFSAQGTWLPTTDPSMGAVLFGSGSWTSSVVPSATGFAHVYVDAFGSQVQSDVSSAVTGPWTGGPLVAPCDLPLTDDPTAFCAGPTVHPELADPTRPTERVVSYGVGSTASSPPGTPEDYWPRVVWLE